MGIDGFRYGGRGLIAACLFCLPSLKEGTAADFSCTNLTTARTLFKSAERLKLVTPLNSVKLLRR